MSQNSENEDECAQSQNNGATKVDDKEIQKIIKELSQDGYSTILEAIEEVSKEFVGIHPKKVMLRKHVDWKRAAEILEGSGFCQSPEVIRKIFYVMCRSIQVERDMTTLMGDLRKSCAKKFQPKLVTPYKVFFDKTLKLYRNEYPEKNYFDHSKMISVKWKSLSDKKKAKYERKCVKINKELIAENPELERKTRKKLAQPKKDLSFKPKIIPPPKTVFEYFCNEYHKNNPHVVGKKRGSVRSKWNKLPAEELKMYCSAHQSYVEQYNKYFATLSSSQQQEITEHYEKPIKDEDKE